MRILVIDDNPGDRAIINRLLRATDLGAEIVEGARTRDLFETTLSSFDCILLDNRLPDGDGIDALNEIDEPSLQPIIVISGQGDELVAARAIKAGAADYMVKDSLTPNRLASAIFNAVERCRAENQTRRDLDAQAEALRLAEQANEAKIRFLSSMSHELRTPLTAISGFAQLIERLSLGGDEAAWRIYRDYAGDIHTSAQHLLKMMSNVLDLVQLETGTSRMKPGDFDPVATIHGAIDIFQERVYAGGLELSANIANAPPRLNTDQKAFKTIIINLLSNALRATPSGGRIHVSLSDLGDGTCRLVVADNGDGMNPEDVARFSRPFELYDGLFPALQDGLGFGLLLVKALVKLIGGTDYIETELGNGTTVTVVIPIDAVTSSDGDSKDV